MNGNAFKSEILKWFFSISPNILSLFWIFFGLLLIIFCKEQLRSIEIRENNRIINVGYLFSFNWSITSLIIAPLLIYHVALFFNEIPISIYGLMETNVLVTRANLASSIPYNLYLTNILLKNETIIIILILLGTLLINIYDFFSYFLRRDSKGHTIVKDWTVLYQGWHSNKVKFSYNMLFNFFAYFSQCIIIFIALIFCYKAFIFFSNIYALISGSNPNYIINLNFTDPMGKLGLWPLGKVVEIYVRFVLLIAMYLVILRFIHVSRNVTWEYGPRLVAVGGVFLISFLFLAPIILLSNKTEHQIFQKKVELTCKIIEYSNQNKQSFQEDPSEVIRKLESSSLVDKLITISRQSMLPIGTQRAYLYLLLLLIQLRLILRPPDSLVELITRLVGQNIE